MSKLLDLWSDMTGVVVDYALKTPPSAGWILCYGQALAGGASSTARLRQKLIDDAFPYGKDASNNPLVPDARGRVFAGVDAMGGTAASRLAVAALGNAMGTETHTLTTAQMPAHAHAITDPGHAHSVYDPGHAHLHGASFIGSGTGSNGGYVTTGNNVSTTAAGTGISIYGAGTGISVQNNGSGGAHNNTQPTLVMNKIIKL